jgi:ribosomal protein S18 acetylase RimI-like enzyme
MVVTLSADEYVPEKLYEMFRSAMEPYVNATRGTPWNESRERTQFLEQLVPQSIQLIRVNDEIVGFVDLRVERDGRNLHTMIVVPERQSQGIGSAILKRLMATSGRITLSVLKTNPRARAFYEGKGFRHVSSSQYHHQMTWGSNSTVERDAPQASRRSA